MTKKVVFAWMVSKVQTYHKINLIISNFKILKEKIAKFLFKILIRQ